jgi:hypothetical protein
MFNLSCARVAYEFIISDLPIKSYAKKYSAGLNEHYGEIKAEEIESASEAVLRFLVEINAENSDELLNAYVYYCLKYKSDGSKRKIKGLFGNAFDPTKEKEFSEKECLRSFKAYVFGLRSGVTYKPAAGWDIKDEDEKEIELVLNIIKKDANITDAL